MIFRRIFSPTGLCITSLVLMLAAQVALLWAKFWPWHAGIVEIVVWFIVFIGAAVALGLVALLLLFAWMQRAKLANRRWLTATSWVFVVLPLANAIYFGWWPTAEKLGQAAQSGNVSLTKRCLSFGIHPDATYVSAAGFGGRSDSPRPLVQAATHGHREVMQLLLDAGADVQGSHNAALRAAVHNAGPAIVKYLLAQGAEGAEVLPDILLPGFGSDPVRVRAAQAMLELKPQAVSTPWPLLVAAHSSHVEIARLLAAVDDQQRYGPTYELFRAVVRGQRDNALTLYTQIKDDLIQPGMDSERIAALKFFANPQRHPNAPLERVNPETLLSVAARFGATELAAVVIEAGAPVDPPLGKFLYLRSPLHRAVWNGHLDTAALLLAAGADANRRNHDLGTPLDAALVQAAPAMIDLLLEAGAEIRAGIPSAP